jgi:hypothetical protein
MQKFPGQYVSFLYQMEIRSAVSPSIAAVQCGPKGEPSNRMRRLSQSRRRIGHTFESGVADLEVTWEKWVKHGLTCSANEK